MNTIKLTPAPSSDAVRVGLGLTLLTSDGVAVRGNVTWADYDKITQLTDGTVGVLRREWTDRGYVYSLEAGEADQDWENETTTWTLSDGTRVQACGAHVRVLPALGELAQEAIRDSISHTIIVTHDDEPGLRDALLAECDDNVESDGIAQYWGTDAAGDNWRVHVRLGA